MTDTFLSAEPTPNKKSERNPRGSFLFLCALFLFVAALDQAAKFFVHREFYNFQFAFSLPVPLWQMYPIYACVSVAMIFYVLKNYRKFNLASQIAWTLIFAGAACNIIERIFLGYVRDFIYITFYRWTGVYNLADGYIIIGIILLLLGSSKVIDKNDKI